MSRVLRMLCWLLVAGGVHAAERDIVRTFAAEPGCTIAIDTYRGGISITESDEPGIRIAVHLEVGGDTAAESERLARELQLNFTERGNLISVIARHPQETGVRFVWRDRLQIEPTFRVTVPRHCNVDLKTRDGSIVVGNLSGRLAAHAETGDVFFRHVAGEIDASTQEGDVVVSHCDGSVKARVLSGTIQLGVITGTCDVRNGNGGIDVMAVTHGIHAHAEAGNIIVGLPRDFAGDSDISTSGGSIIAKVDPSANCELAASASWFSRVDCHLPSAAKIGGSGRRKLVAKVNHGGPRVVLHASGGDVELEPGETPLADVSGS